MSGGSGKHQFSSPWKSRRVQYWYYWNTRSASLSISLERGTGCNWFTARFHLDDLLPPNFSVLSYPEPMFCFEFHLVLLSGFDLGWSVPRLFGCLKVADVVKLNTISPSEAWESHSEAPAIRGQLYIPFSQRSRCLVFSLAEISRAEKFDLPCVVEFLVFFASLRLGELVRIQIVNLPWYCFVYFISFSSSFVSSCQFLDYCLSKYHFFYRTTGVWHDIFSAFTP